MTAPPPAVCPVCSGPWQPNHPGGPVPFVHSNQCALRDAEDSTMVADRERAATLGTFQRASTDAEKTLLAQFAKTAATTAVTFLTPSVRRRTFPDLTALPV